MRPADGRGVRDAPQWFTARMHAKKWTGKPSIARNAERLERHTMVRIPREYFTAIVCLCLSRFDPCHSLVVEDVPWPTPQVSLDLDYDPPPRLESLCTEYAAGHFPPDWRIAEGVFPSLGDERAIHLTVLFKPAENGFRSIYCVVRYRCVSPKYEDRSC